MIDAAKLHQVLTWMFEGNSDHLIREAIAGTWPGEDAQPLILAAMQQIEKSGETSHADVENWCFEATRHLYQKQVEIGEYAGAMRALRQMQDISASRTKQLPAPKQVVHHHQHELGPITSENIEEHRRRIACRIAGISQDAGRPAGG